MALFLAGWTKASAGVWKVDVRLSKCLGLVDCRNGFTCGQCRLQISRGSGTLRNLLHSYREVDKIILYSEVALQTIFVEH